MADLSPTAPMKANTANHLVVAAAPVPPPTKGEPPSLAPPVSEASLTGLSGDADDDLDDPDVPISEEKRAQRGVLSINPITKTLVKIYNGGGTKRNYREWP